MRRRRGFEIFSLSFLDVISCGFGAIVMLLLITKTGVVESNTQSSGPERLQSYLQITNANDAMRADIGRAEGEIESTKQEIADLQAAIGLLSQKMQEAQNLGDELKAGNAGLQADVVSAAQALKRKSSKPASLKEVGGIPVDADYVIFVVDTSGSMQSIWRKVVTTIDDIIQIHPEVKGIQILSDMGEPIVASYRGKWFPDTPGWRKRLTQALYSWQAYSNSNPTEGIQEAIATYCKPDKKVAVYVFADDFTGSADMVIRAVESKAKAARLGADNFRIHGVIFVTQTGPQMSNFMRYLTAAHDGTLISVN